MEPTLSQDDSRGCDCVSMAEGKRNSVGVVTFFTSSVCVVGVGAGDGAVF